MLSAKQRNYWYQFFQRLWFDTVLYWGLNTEPSALDASTLPLGYQGGGFRLIINKTLFKKIAPF